MRLVVSRSGPLRDVVWGDPFLCRVLGGDLRENHGPQKRPRVSGRRASLKVCAGHHQIILNRQVRSIFLVATTRIMIYKGMFYKSKYWILEKI